MPICFPRGPNYCYLLPCGGRYFAQSSPMATISTHPFQGTHCKLRLSKCSSWVHSSCMACLSLPCPSLPLPSPRHAPFHTVYSLPEEMENPSQEKERCSGFCNEHRTWFAREAGLYMVRIAWVTALVITEIKYKTTAGVYRQKLPSIRRLREAKERAPAWLPWRSEWPTHKRRGEQLYGFCGRLDLVSQGWLCSQAESCWSRVDGLVPIRGPRWNPHAFKGSPSHARLWRCCG